MICDICGKDNAIMHIRQVMNGNNDVSLNLCESCAMKNGFQMGQNGPVQLPDLLEKLREFKKGLSGSTEDLNIVCHNCNTTLSEVKKTGIVGCCHCYDYFDEYLNQYLANPAGSKAKGNRSRGPVRTVLSQSEYKKALEKKLADAVSIEDYEEAAVLRDKIKALEG